MFLYQFDNVIHRDHMTDNMVMFRALLFTNIAVIYLISSLFVVHRYNFGATFYTITNNMLYMACMLSVH